VSRCVNIRTNRGGPAGSNGKDKKKRENNFRGKEKKELELINADRKTDGQR